jgi:hypothetical protein
MQTEDNGEVKVEELQKQEGVFRTNCMDCLDRTNVVQSVLARNVLLSQLFSVRTKYNDRPESLRNPTEMLLKNYLILSRKPSENSGQTMEID